MNEWHLEAWQPVFQVPSALITNVKLIAMATDLQQTTEFK